MKNVLVCIIMHLALITAWSQETPDTISVVATGLGVDKSAALKNAFHNAVQQALGLYIDATTQVENDMVVREQILTHAAGFVQSYTQVSQRTEGGLSYVTISAIIIGKTLEERIKAHNIAVRGVAGENLYAQIITQEQEDADAATLALTVLRPFFDNMMSVDLIGEPKVANRSGASIKLQQEIRYQINEDAYFQAAKKLVEVWDQLKIPSKALNLSVTYPKAVAGLAYFPGQEPVAGRGIINTGLNKPDADTVFVLVLTEHNTAATQTQWRCYSVSREWAHSVPCFIAGRTDGNRTGDTTPYAVNLHLALHNADGADVALAQQDFKALGGQKKGQERSVFPFAATYYDSSFTAVAQYYVISPYLVTGDGSGPRFKIERSVTLPMPIDIDVEALKTVTQSAASVTPAQTCTAAALFDTGEK